MDLTPDEIERYKRHLLLSEVGAQGQKQLKSAHVAVIGAGGISSPLLMYLAAAGVGTLSIIEADTVDLSNLQRQVLHGTSSVGQSKLDSAAKAINQINPLVNLNLYEEMIDQDNIARLLSGADLIAEGVDNFSTRFVLNKFSISKKVPLVSAAVGRYTLQLSVFHPGQEDAQNPCYRCLVPEAPPESERFDCSREGVLGPITGIAGTLAAMEVIKWLTGIGEPLIGRVLVHDGLAGTGRTVKLRANLLCPDCGS